MFWRINAPLIQKMEDFEPELRPGNERRGGKVKTSLFWFPRTPPNPFGCAAGGAETPAL